MNPSEPRKRTRPWLPVVLVLVPAWLLVSAGLGLWMHFRSEKRSQARLDTAFSRMVSETSLADDIDKLSRVIGERHTGSPEAQSALDQAARMIEGALGPSNTGLDIVRWAGPGKWPILATTLPGSRPDLPAIWVLAPYDSRRGGGTSDAAATAVLLAATQALVATPPVRPIHIAFLPHGNDPEAPVSATISRLSERMKDACAILAVDLMGGGSSLCLTIRDPESPVSSQIQGLGEIRVEHDGAPRNGLAAMLFASGLPAVRVATRGPLAGQEAEAAPVDAGELATSTGRLVTLIQRVAGTGSD